MPEISEAEALEYHAYVTWRGNVCSDVNIREFTLTIDTNTDGKNQGPNPTEVLLAAVGGCMIVNYGRLSRKMGLKIDSIKINLYAKRPKMLPKVSEIRYDVQIKSNEDIKKLEHLRKLAEKNGTVFNTIRNGTKIFGTLKVISGE
ncbi:MAG: OsmC family protein [Candidatus Asgardarchaeia archaeon]